MKEKMLVTQALDERDLLVKKITDKINKVCFVDVKKHNEEKVFENRISEEEYKKQTESAYQQIFDLIQRFQKIDVAIVASNASHYIETSYGKFTIAGALSLRTRLKENGIYGEHADFEMILCDKFEKDYQSKIQFIEMKNKQLEATAENMRLSILGKDNKTKDDKPLEVVETYVKENTMELIDPLNILKKIEQISEKTETLIKELDTQIKVSNATTFIEI